MPGAPEAVQWLRDQGLTVRFTTNTTRSLRPPSPDRVARLGFPASEDELVTPIAVAERLFASSPQARVLAGCLAGPGDRVTHVLVAESQLRGDLRRAGRRLPGRPGRGGAGRHQVNRIAARDDGEHLDTGGWVFAGPGSCDRFSRPTTPSPMRLQGLLVFGQSLDGCHVDVAWPGELRATDPPDGLEPELRLPVKPHPMSDQRG